jgi:Chaperone of endosialidase
MMKNLFSIFLVLSCLSNTNAQIGIKANGTAPISSAQLEVQSTNKAFYPPRMTTAQRTSFPNAPQAGAVVYDTDLNGLFTFNGSAWVAGSGLSLPYSSSQNSSEALLNITNSNTITLSPSIVGVNNSVFNIGGIIGSATNANPTGDSYGIKGINFSTNGNGFGVYGQHIGTGSGVYGHSNSGIGIRGDSYNNIGGYFSSFSGKALETSGAIRIGGSGVGVIGADKFLKSISSSGDAQWSDLLPYANIQSYAGGSLITITNSSTQNYSSGIVVETSTNNGGKAILGFATNPNPTGNNFAVSGYNYAQNSYGYAVYGEHQGFGVGVYGACNSGTGVFGESISGTGGYFSSSTGSALITGIGKVGIGVPNPNQILDVKGRMRIRHTTGYTSGLWMSNSINSLSDADGAFYGMKLDTETGFFIGGSWKFWVNNLGNGYLNGNLIQTSDRRLKKDLSLLNNSLSDIYQLKGYHYKWLEASRSQDLQTGLIAQEVQKIFPELVQTDEKGFLSVNYIGLIPHLIEAVKELRNENATLKNKNQFLENRLDKIEEILSVSASKK